MKLSDIFKKVGAGIIKDAIPGGSVIMGVINELLPNKLPDNATGKDLQSAIESLPIEDQAQLLDKQFDVDIATIKEEGDTLRTIMSLDQHSTRPFIARWSFITVAAVTMLIVVMWSYAVTQGNIKLVLSITNGWPMILALLTPFFVLLRGYFGILQKESQNKLDASNGNPTSSIVGTLISGFMSRKG